MVYNRISTCEKFGLNNVVLCGDEWINNIFD